MRNKLRARSACAVTLLFLQVVVGCGGKPAVVSGVVTVDGNPLNTGTVTFAPVAGGLRASGLIQSDGTYVVKTNRDAGLETGEYDVAVVSREVISTGPDTPPRPGKFFAPQHYGRPNSSGLHYTVEAGSNEINLELTSDEKQSE